MVDNVQQRFVGRRGFLAGALAAGSAVGLAACSSDSAGSSGPPVAPEAGPPTGTIAPQSPATPPAAVPGTGALPPMRLFTDDTMNFDALFGLGTASYGISEAGEVLTAVNQANAAGAGYDSYVAAFRAMGDRLATASDAAAAAGNAVTSRDTAMRAATYYTRALFFVLGTAHPETEPDVYASYRRAWDRGIGGPGLALGARPAAVPLQVTYDGGTLPAWLFRPADDGVARRTVIVNNGSDAQGVELIAYGVRAALDRGWNAVVFDGPGQGEMLFVRGTSFRPDWEQVITPVVDALAGRDDVDADRIALTGWSMGGALVVRAAAYEDRLAAVVSDPGTVDPWAAFPESIRSIVNPDNPELTNTIWNDDVVPSLTPQQRFTLAKRLEIFTPDALAAARNGTVTSDFAAAAAQLVQFDVRDAAGQIRCPVLVLDYDDEDFYPGQPDELMGLLTTDRKDLVKLTSADGAQMHCAPMAPVRRNEVVFDWLDEVVPA